MKRLHRLLVLSTALGFAATLAAQTSDSTAPRGPRGGPPGGHFGKGGPGRGGPGHPVIRALDANGDREISADEIAAAPANLAKLDRDGDGTVTVAELQPPRPVDAPAREGNRTPPANAPARDTTRARPLDPVMLALDANANGALEAGEIVGAARSLAAIDANGDGKLTLDELRPLPPTE